MAETADDLSAPLGQKKAREKRRYRLPFTGTQALAVLLGLFLVGFVGFAIFNDNPLGGEPMVRIALPQPTPGEKPAAATPPAAEPVMKSAAKQPATESKTVTIIDGSSGKHQEVMIGGDGADKAEPGAPPTMMAMAGIDQRLLEKSRYGMIPVIADGLKPFTAYAAEADRAKAAKMPVVAIVVGGLGVGAAKTTDAIMKLPPAVTLAFTPYGSDPSKLAERARTQRHEILLQVPMEPFDYPDNDPGPQTLLTSLSPDQNLDRLYWHLSRLQGYAGIANFMGARFVVNRHRDDADHPRGGQARPRLLRRRLGAAQRGGRAGGHPGDAVCQGRCHHRRGADGGRDRPRAGQARKSRKRTRLRGRHRLGAADFDRSHRRLGQNARRPRHHACAIDNRHAQIKIELKRIA